MIETERLRLRPWAETDKPTFEAIINTPAMMAHFGGVWPAGGHDVLIDAQMESQACDGFSMWAVDWRATGQLIGICGLRRAHHPDTPVTGDLEIGWRIAEPFWGKGIAREAAAASLDWGWSNTGDRRIIAYTTASNARSWGLMKRLGMERRTDLDFRHPKFAVDDPLGAMIVYGIEAAGVIGTQRLTLRPWTEADRAPFGEMGRDVEVMRYLGGLRSRAETDAAIDRQIALQDMLGHCFWAIARREDGAFLGFCGLKPGPAGTPIADEIEIGWRLRRDAWGKGYAREAAQASLDWGWANLPVPEITAITVLGNTRSWGLMERLGMMRDTASDFEHPDVMHGDPLRPHITYRIGRLSSAAGGSTAR